jgi:hypothetical protein
MLCLFLHRNAELRSNLQKGRLLLSFVGDEEVRMVNNKELESGLRAMVEDTFLAEDTRSFRSGSPDICTGSTPPSAAAWACGT